MYYVNVAQLRPTIKMNVVLSAINSFWLYQKQRAYLSYLTKIFKRLCRPKWKESSFSNWTNYDTESMHHVTKGFFKWKIISPENLINTIKENDRNTAY